MNILLFGCGAVGRTLLLIFKKKRPRYITKTSKLLVIDKDDRKSLLKTLELKDIFAEIGFIQANICEDNYKQLERIIKTHNSHIFIDATYGVRTLSLLQVIDKCNIPYINSSVEEWDITADGKGNPEEHSLSKRQKEIAANEFKNKPTCLLDMGVNPGLISAMTKRAIRNFHKQVFNAEIENIAVATKNLDIKAAIITELDCQITVRPRRRGEFCNTWSPDGYIEEAYAPAEYTNINVGVVVDPMRSYYHLVYSRVPSGYYTGYAVRHSEAITIGKMLQGNDPTPPATVFYAYQSCDASIASLFEMQNTHYYITKRTLTNDIIDGTDEVGILILSPTHGSYWCGTMQSIHDARRLFPEKYHHLINASTVQTASGYFAGVSWIVDHPGLGVIYPEILPDNFVFGAMQDLIEPMYDGMIDFDINTKPSKFTVPKKTEVSYSFESFTI